MTQGSDSKSKSIKYWTDTLKQWEKKRTQYERQTAETSDPAEVQELKEGLKVCQDVIQTCQGLIQTLNQGSATFYKNTAPSDDPTSQGTPIPSTSAHSTLSGPPLAAPARKQHQRIMGGSILLVLLLVTTFSVIFRPRNVCKIAPDGTHRADGLTLWVRQALQTNSQYPNELDQVVVAQLGCTVVLRGTVSSEAVIEDLVTITENLEIPGQSTLEQLQRQLNWGEPTTVKPVEDVITEVQIAPR